MAKNDFTNFSQGYDIEILDLFKQKEFYSYEYLSDFEKYKEQLWNKENFIVHWQVKKNSDTDTQYARQVWNKFNMKTMKDGHN